MLWRRLSVKGLLERCYQILAADKYPDNPWLQAQAFRGGILASPPSPVGWAGPQTVPWPELAELEPLTSTHMQATHQTTTTAFYFKDSSTLVGT